MLQRNIQRLENTVSENQGVMRRQLVQMNGEDADKVEPQALLQTHQRALDDKLGEHQQLQQNVNNLQTRLCQQRRDTIKMLEYVAKKERQKLEQDELLITKQGDTTFENGYNFTHAQVNTQSGVNPVHVTGQTRPRAVSRLTDVEVNEDREKSSPSLTKFKTKKKN